MYAIFETGGKQYKASVGEVLEVEKLPADSDGKVELKNLISIVDESDEKFGPEVSGRSVIAEVIAETKGEKITSFKSKRRKGYSRKIGHRQPYSRIRITEIR